VSAVRVRGDHRAWILGNWPRDPSPRRRERHADRDERAFDRGRGAAGAGDLHHVGPDLDETALTPDQIAEIASSGRGGMPSLADRVDENQIERVAAFVAESSQASK
jgi:mono/diheme cytochrome c family protein